MQALWLTLPSYYLIFFLVTTTIEVDSGISSKLPPDVPPPEVKLNRKTFLLLS